MLEENNGNMTIYYSLVWQPWQRSLFLAIQVCNILEPIKSFFSRSCSRKELRLCAELRRRKKRRCFGKSWVIWVTVYPESYKGCWWICAEDSRKVRWWYMQDVLKDSKWRNDKNQGYWVEMMCKRLEKVSWLSSKVYKYITQKKKYQRWCCC